MFPSGVVGVDAIKCFFATKLLDLSRNNCNAPASRSVASLNLSISSAMIIGAGVEDSCDGVPAPVKIKVQVSNCCSKFVYAFLSSGKCALKVSDALKSGCNLNLLKRFARASVGNAHIIVLCKTSTIYAIATISIVVLPV